MLLLFVLTCATTGQTDVALTVKPDGSGLSSLGFFVYGGAGADFTLQNDNEGVLSLKSADKDCLVIDNAGAHQGATAKGTLRLLELDETFEPVHHTADYERQLLSEIHSRRKKLQQARKSMRRYQGSNRRLLAMVDQRAEISLAQASLAAGDPVVGTGAPAYKLAEQIKATQKIKVSGSIGSALSGNVKVCQTKQWKMITHEDFMKGTIENWQMAGSGASGDNPPVHTCQTPVHDNADYFMGTFEHNVDVSKTFLLPAHSKLRIKARMHFIDRWEGQSLFMKINGNIMWSQAHNWCSKLLITMCEPRAKPADAGMTLSVCGQPTFPDKVSVPVEITLAHTAEALEVRFGSTLTEPSGDIADASWGLDDFQIYII